MSRIRVCGPVTHGRSMHMSLRPKLVLAAAKRSNVTCNTQSTFHIILGQMCVGQHSILCSGPLVVWKGSPFNLFGAVTDYTQCSNPRQAVHSQETLQPMPKELRRMHVTVGVPRYVATRATGSLSDRNPNFVDFSTERSKGAVRTKEVQPGRNTRAWSACLCSSAAGGNTAAVPTCDKCCESRHPHHFFRISKKNVFCRMNALRASRRQHAQVIATLVHPLYNASIGRPKAFGLPYDPTEDQDRPLAPFQPKLQSKASSCCLCGCSQVCSKASTATTSPPPRPPGHTLFPSVACLQATPPRHFAFLLAQRHTIHSCM